VKLRITVPALRLPDRLRRTLQIPLSTLYISKNWVKELNIEYCVGDIVSKNQKCKYMIVDGKTHREKFEEKLSGYKIVNPRGTLSLNTLTILKAKRIRNLHVIGEEDLIVLGIGSEYKATIAYGQPYIGVVVVNSTPYWTTNIIKAFKPDIDVYE